MTMSKWYGLYKVRYLTDFSAKYIPQQTLPCLNIAS